jgi:hypothetical protein
LGEACAPGVPATSCAAAVRRRAEGAVGMKANCWVSPNTVEVHDVPDPSILNDRDAIVQITSTAICGSDLHLLDGCVPTMQEGDVMGHEFMGEVIEVGRGVDSSKLRVGTGSSYRSRSPAARAPPARRSSTPAARTAIRTRGSPRRCSVTRWPASSATPTSRAATPAASRSSRVSPSPTSTPCASSHT